MNIRMYFYRQSSFVGDIVFLVSLLFAAALISHHIKAKTIAEQFADLQSAEETETRRVEAHRSWLRQHGLPRLRYQAYTEAAIMGNGSLEEVVREAEYKLAQDGFYTRSIPEILRLDDDGQVDQMAHARERLASLGDDLWVDVDTEFEEAQVDDHRRKIASMREAGLLERQAPREPDQSPNHTR